jgi:putative chitinase
MVDMHFIDMIDAPLLKIGCPERSLAQLEPLVAPFKKVCIENDISTIRRIGAWIGQISVESGLIYDREENLNYSAQGLANTWPNRYAVDPRAKVKVPNALAKKLNRNPMAIANNVYANRMGNGSEASGDGWKYRGFTLKQITGCSNWTAFGKSVGMTADQALAYGRTVEGSVAAAAWFWKTNGLNPLADSPGVEDETHRINGGYNGLDDRRTRFNNVVNELLRRERLLRKN